MVITDRTVMRPSFESALESALRGGARLIQLREKDLPPRDVLTLASHAARLCNRWGASLLVNSRADIALAAHAGGVHLPANDLAPCDARLTLGKDAFCGVSIHSVEEAQRAADEGADYLVFGSVFETASHPGGPSAGIKELRKVVGAVPLPVFAVGGIDAERAKLCREAGAYGVAAISAIWRADDIAAAVAAFEQ